MKKLIIIIAGIIAVSTLRAQGIQFFSGTFEQAMQKAATEHKKIFVDVYTTWCGPCKMMMKQVFPDPTVGEFYNQNFVALKLDAENEKSHGFFKKYRAQGFPTYFWLDEKGELLDTHTGACDPKSFIKLAEKALKSNVGAENRRIEQSWNAGDRSSEIIEKYIFKVLPMNNPQAVYPILLEYLTTLTPEMLNAYSTFELYGRVVAPRNSFFSDNLMTQTYLGNLPAYRQHHNKFNTDIQALDNRIYREFIRMLTSGYLKKQGQDPETDRKIEDALQLLQKYDFAYTDFVRQCLDVEKTLYSKKYAEAIAKMGSVVAQWGEEFPTIRNNFLYSLVISEYYQLAEKPALDRVEQMAEENLRKAPSRNAVFYYALTLKASGKTEKAFDVLAWMRFYDGSEVSNAVYRSMNIQNIRREYPVSTPETEAENARVKNLAAEK